MEEAHPAFTLDGFTVQPVVNVPPVVLFPIPPAIVAPKAHSVPRL